MVLSNLEKKWKKNKNRISFYYWIVLLVILVLALFFILSQFIEQGFDSRSGNEGVPIFSNPYNVLIGLLGLFIGLFVIGYFVLIFQRVRQLTS